ncbi:hypothetical protein BCR43DRAFT_505437 [Syncephalastrum racemosum]|uniref:Uncharacterized protein n=1 Tax=Syncephalastrum racemosum TaxID=13706 RepID=A0A1X2HCS8_SYNRA|nr:hypothetical protein BCR43DRAFT_505437 [Syncephalastrum racemosum]
MRLTCCVCGKEFPEYDQRGFRNAGFTAHQNRCIDRERLLRDPPIVSPRARRVLLPAPPPPVITTTVAPSVSVPPAIVSASSSSTDNSSSSRISTMREAYQSGFHPHYHQYQYLPQNHASQSIRQYYRTYNTPSRTRRRHSYQGSHRVQNYSSAACHQPLTASPVAWFYPSTPVTASTTISAPSIEEIMNLSEVMMPPTTSSAFQSATGSTVPMTMPYHHDPYYQESFTSTFNPFAILLCDYCRPQQGLHDINCPVLHMFQSSSDGMVRPPPPPGPPSTSSDRCYASAFPYRT